MNIHQVFKSYSKKVWRKIASLPIKLNENNMGVSHTQRRRRNIKLEANIIRIECVELCGVCKTLYVHFFCGIAMCVCARVRRVQYTHLDCGCKNAASQSLHIATRKTVEPTLNHNYLTDTTNGMWIVCLSFLCRVSAAHCVMHLDKHRMASSVSVLSFRQIYIFPWLAECMKLSLIVLHPYCMLEWTVY